MGRAQKYQLMHVSLGTVLVLLFVAGPVAALRLTRQQALRMAATSNLEMVSRKLTRDRGALARDIASDAYLPDLYIDAAYNDNAPINTDRERTVDYRAGMKWQTPVGTHLDVSAGVDHFVTGYGSSVVGPSGQVSLSQSLLKDRGTNGGSALIHQAELETVRQRELFHHYLSSFLVRVDNAYWDLVAAQEEREIKLRSLERAKKQFADTKENIARGILATTEIYIVEENVVIFEQALLGAETKLRLAQSRLSNLLGKTEKTFVLAVESLAQVTVVLPEEETAQKGALQRNPRLRSERTALEKSKVNLVYVTNQTLPKLDVSASLTINGLSSDFGPQGAETPIARNPDLMVGMYFEIPLSQIANRAKIEQAQIEKRKRLTDYSLKEQQLLYRIQDLLTALRSQKKILELAGRRYNLAELKLEAESEKYKSGISTLADVVRFQRESDESLLKYRSAKTDMLKNYARLRDAEGLLVRDLGIRLK